MTRNQVSLWSCLCVTGLVFVGCSSGPAASDDAEVTAATTAKLIQTEDCLTGSVNGKVGICHATGSTTNPYAYVRVSTKGCINGHAQHPGDFVSDDPACQSCVPTTCEAQSKNCGSIADGCGGSLDCGTCVAPQTCGGGDTTNVCGCTPSTCSQIGATCGAVTDGCGSIVDCGSCPPSTGPEKLWSTLENGSAAFFGQISASAVDLVGNTYATGRYFDSYRMVTFLMKTDSSGIQSWIRSVPTPTDAGGTGVATGADGNVYVTGYTTGALPGSVQVGPNDVTLLKYNRNGDLLWTKQAGVPGESSFGHGLAVAEDGSIYVTGRLLGSLPEGVSAGADDALLMKFDASGNQLWARQFGGSGADWGFRVALDALGRILVFGDTESNLPGNITSGGRDAFLASFDSEGNLVRITQFGSSGMDGGRGDVVADNEGNAFVTGFWNGNWYWGEASQAFVGKIDATGQLKWVRLFGTGGAANIGTELDLGRGGALYLSAIANRGSCCGSDAGDGYFAKLDALGQSIWEVTYPLQGQIWGMGVDGVGYIYLAGILNSGQTYVAKYGQP